MISDESPVTASYIPPISAVTLSVNISDADNDTLNGSISYPGGGYSFSNVIPAQYGVKECTWNISGNFQPGTTYNWTVNVSDGTSTTSETYSFIVPWLTCALNETALGAYCNIDGIPPFDWYLYTYLRYTDTETELWDHEILFDTSTVHLGATEGLTHGKTYLFESEWLPATYGNNHTLQMYQCYENQTPTGCGEGYYCDVHNCTYNTTTYNSTNGTYSLTITDLTNVSAGYSPKITAQYMNGSTPIEGASCYYTSNGFTLALDNLNEDAFHNYTSYVIIADNPGNRSYIVTCSATGYPTLQDIDHFWIQGAGETYPTTIEWILSPSTVDIDTNETFSVAYKTTSGQGIPEASCNFTISIQTVDMTDDGGGNYSRIFEFTSVASYTYYATCGKTGYETATTEYKTIVVTSGSHGTTTTTISGTTTTIISPASGWNCTSPLALCQQGNIAHCVLCPFYNVLGAWFFGIMLFLVCIMAYMKTGTVAAPSIISISIGGAYALYLPPEVHAVAGLALGIGLAGIFYMVYKG